MFAQIYCSTESLAISSLVAPTIVTERVSCKLQGPTRELEKSTVIQLYNFMLIALNSNSTISVVFAYKLISRLCFTSTRDKFEEEGKMGSIILTNEGGSRSTPPNWTTQKE